MLTQKQEGSMKKRLNSEQESQLVVAIKAAFPPGRKFDATSVFFRATLTDSDPRLLEVLESVVGPKARYKSGWRRGEFKYGLCRSVILTVVDRFETDSIGWWSWN
jgi:hypothetical protein